MVQVRVGAVALDAAGQHVILLKPIGEAPGEGRILPIWIGAQEATSILIAIEGAVTPRPLAHDLMRTMLATLDAEVEQVAVTRIDDGTYYAEISLTTGSGIRRIDARPSDAVALASRVGAAIWVADAVLEEAGVPDTLIDADLEADVDAAGGGEPGVNAEESLDEFKKFLEGVDPDDFRG